MSRPRLVLVALALLTVAGALLALALAPSTGVDTLVSRSSADYRATQLDARQFGAAPVVVLVRLPLTQLIESHDLTTISELEACLGGQRLALSKTLGALEPVSGSAAVPYGGRTSPCGRLMRGRYARVVYGPGTFLNRAVAAVTGEIRSLSAAAARTVKAAEQAALALARARGLSSAQARADARQAGELALEQQLGTLSELAGQAGIEGTPSLENSQFLGRIVFSKGSTPNPRFSYLFPDADHAVIQVRLRAGLSDAQQARAITLIREAVAMPRFRLAGASYLVTGEPVVLSDLGGGIADQLLLLLVGAVVVMAVALVLGFRARLRLLPLALALAAVAITFGLSELVGASLTLAGIAVLPVLVGLGVDYAVQFQSGTQPRSILTAALATAAGFLVLLLSPVPMVQGFGLLLVVGVGVAVAVVAVAVPAALAAVAVPAGRVAVPAGRGTVPAGRVAVPAGRGTVPAGRGAVPAAGRGAVPAAGRGAVPAAGGAVPVGRGAVPVAGGAVPAATAAGPAHREPQPPPPRVEKHAPDASFSTRDACQTARTSPRVEKHAPDACFSTRGGRRARPRLPAPLAAAARGAHAALEALDAAARGAHAALEALDAAARGAHAALEALDAAARGAGEIVRAPLPPLASTLTALTRRPRLVLALGLVLALAGWALETQTAVQSDITKLVPPGLPALADLGTLEHVTGVSGEIDVVVHTSDVATPRTVAWMVAYENRMVSHFGYSDVRGCARATICPALSLPDLFQSITGSGTSTGTGKATGSGTSAGPGTSTGKATGSGTSTSTGKATRPGTSTGKATGSGTSTSTGKATGPGTSTGKATGSGTSAGPGTSTTTTTTTGTSGAGAGQRAGATRLTRASINGLLASVPGYFQRAVITPNRRYATLAFGIRLMPLARQRRVIAYMRAALHPPAGVSAALAGLPVLAADADGALASSGRRLLTLAAGLLLVGLVLLAALRSVRRALVPLAPIVLATGWSALVLYLLRIPLNPLSATLGALVIAISTEFSVLLAERVRRERAAGLSAAAATERAYRSTGAAVVVSGVTAIAGFGVLVLSNIAMLRDFGFVTLVDLTVSLAGVLLVLPAVIAVASDTEGSPRIGAGP